MLTGANMFAKRHTDAGLATTNAQREIGALEADTSEGSHDRFITRQLTAKVLHHLLGNRLDLHGFFGGKGAIHPPSCEQMPTLHRECRFLESKNVFCQRFVKLPENKTPIVSCMNRRKLLRFASQGMVGGIALHVLAGCANETNDSQPTSGSPLTDPRDAIAAQPTTVVKAPLRKSGFGKVTFKVNDIARATNPLPEITFEQSMRLRLEQDKRPLESWEQRSGNVVSMFSQQRSIHAFLLTLNLAYADHRPVVLSPDMIWLLILQGLAQHVNANAESLRDRFVTHQGKLLINIRRDNFQMGSVKNDWEGVFGEFSSRIREHIGADTHKLLVADFSTTGSIEQAAMEVALMDALQSYFTYGVTTACGIPEFTLEGVAEDWRELRARAKQLVKFDLDWWLPALVPVLDGFVNASEGKIDKAFWCDFYKLESPGSGAPSIHGHVQNLFPYFGVKIPSKESLLKDVENYIRNSGTYPGISDEQIQQKIAEFNTALEKPGQLASLDTLRRNPYLGRRDLSLLEGMKTEDISTLLASAPFVWSYLGTEYPMTFLAGFMGATQDANTLALRPLISWAIRHTG